MNALLILLMPLVAGFTIVSVVRVARGPTIFDRILAANFGVVASVVMIVMVSFSFGRPEMFVDIALSYALLAFLFPIAFARFLGRRDEQ